MTRDDTLKILAVLKAAYPNFYKDMSKTEADGIVALWGDMFSGDDYNAVAMAVKSFIATDIKGFPPVIGVIRNHLTKLMEPEQMTEFEAWNMVKKALSNSAYGAKEEFDKLPPILQKLVGSPNQLREWGMMDLNQIQTVVSSNFMRSYRVRAENEREYAALPESVKTMSGLLAEKFKMPELGDGK